MKKTLAFLLIFGTKLMAQQTQSIPDTPKKLEFAGVTVSLDRDAQMLVQNEVNNLLTPQNRYLEEKLERMQWYFPLIEAVLEEEELPDDFKYLAVLESSLLSDAESTSNAIGFWQIKLQTAQELGLKIDSNIDERKNIFASTRAAAMYLKRNNLVYHNWISSLFSYRLGATGISQMIPSEWAYANEVKLNAATDRYILRALAHRIAYEHRLNRLKDSPYEFIEYKSAKGKSLKNISTELSFDINELAKHNAWISLNANIPADKDYSVLILSRREDTKTILAKISNPNNPSSMDIGFPILHRITTSNNPDEPIFYSINDKKGILAQPGDDVARLASKGKLKVYSFLTINDMTDKELVKEGRVYYLQPKNSKAKIPYHTVANDQTLWDISQMYGIKLSKLLKYNRLESVQRLQSGRVVWLQKKRPKNQPIEYIKDVAPSTPQVPASSTNTEVIASNENKPTETTEIKPVEEKKKGGFWDIFKSKKKEENKTTETPNTEKEVIVSTETPKDPNSNTNVLNPNPNEPKPVFNDEPKTTTNEPTVVVTNTPVEPSYKPSANTSTPPSRPTTPIYEQPKTNNTPKNPVVVNNTGVHLVEQGETLYSLSRKYGISVKDLAEFNGFSTSENLRYGQKVYLRSGMSTANNVTPAEKVVNNSVKTHIVQKNETLFSISRQYGLSVSAIQSMNNLTDNSISVGQELIVSGGNPQVARPANVESSPKAQNIVHTVEKGDTMFNISKRYGVTVQQIQSWNGLSDVNVKLGQQLVIKK